MTYVISDPHGNKARFDSVLKNAGFGPADHLYILGDVIDRHSDGIELLQTIAAAENMTMLLGNHEYMMLNSVSPANELLPWKRGDALEARHNWFYNGGLPTLRAYEALSAAEQKALRDFLATLPLNVDLTVNGIAYKLVHAAPVELFEGHYGRLRAEYRDAVEFAVWHRFEDFRYIPEAYVMLFGHTPTCFYQEDPTLSIWYGDGVIDLDCGSGFPRKASAESFWQGRLACLRLEDMRAFYSDM